MIIVQVMILSQLYLFEKIVNILVWTSKYGRRCVKYFGTHLRLNNFHFLNFELSCGLSKKLSQVFLNLNLILLKKTSKLKCSRGR